MVLSIGCNYKGMLPREADYIDRIKRELFNGVDPEWVLCPMRWCWTQDKQQTSIAPKTKTYTSATPPVAVTR
ncbi:hypothetical protein CPB85DRAFT_1307959, partial [Mucidula mucida]